MIIVIDPVSSVIFLYDPSQAPALFVVQSFGSCGIGYLLVLPLIIPRDGLEFALWWWTLAPF
jgi:hypothetical protein